MVKKKQKNIFDIIVNIIIILLSILVIYWFIQLIFGGSPELSEFNFALIILIAGFFIKIYREIGEMGAKMKYSFHYMKGDMEKMKEDIRLIKNKLKI